MIDFVGSKESVTTPRAVIELGGKNVALPLGERGQTGAFGFGRLWPSSCLENLRLDCPSAGLGEVGAAADVHRLVEHVRLIGA